MNVSDREDMVIFVVEPNIVIKSDKIAVMESEDNDIGII